MKLLTTFQMFYRFIFANKLLTKLSSNVCNRCLRRFVSTKREIIRKRTKNDNLLLYIKEPKTAQLVVKHLNSSLAENEFFIFESCPGTGLLTQELLKTNAQSVRVFEDNPLFLNKLRVSDKCFA